MLHLYLSVSAADLGHMVPCVVYAQPAPEHAEFTLFISFPGEVVGIRLNRRVSPGPRGGAPTSLLTDASAPPFAGNVLLKSMREKQLVSFKAPERKSPAVPQCEESHKLTLFRSACLVL